MSAISVWHFKWKGRMYEIRKVFDVEDHNVIDGYFISIMRHIRGYDGDNIVAHIKKKCEDCEVIPLCKCCDDDWFDMAEPMNM